MIGRISFTIAVINVALKQGSKTIRVTKKLDSRVLKILYEQNVITNVCLQDGCCVVKLNINLEKKIKIINWCRCGSKIHLTPNQITKLKLNHQIGFYIFLTAAGFVNQHELLKKKTTGILMYQIVLK